MKTHAKRKPLLVTGCLVPPPADVPITIEVLDPDDKSHLLQVMTDAQGVLPDRPA